MEFLETYALMVMAEDRRRAMREEVIRKELAAEAIGNRQHNWSQGIVALLRQASSFFHSLVRSAEHAAPRTSTAVNQP